MSKKASPKWLFVSYLCVAVIVIVLASLYGSYRLQDLHVQQTRADLEVRARLCTKQIIELLRTDDPQSVDDLCKELGNDAKTRITVIRTSGEVVGDTDEDPQKMEDHSNRPEIKQAIERGVGHSTRYSDTVEKTLMYVAITVPKGNAPLAVVRTSIPITTVDDRLNAVAQMFLFVGLLTIVLIVFAIPWFSIRFAPAPEKANRQREVSEEDYP